MIPPASINPKHPIPLIINDLPAAIYTCDLSGRINYFNEAAAQLWGRRPVLGKDMWSGACKMYDSEAVLLPAETAPMAIAVRSGKATQPKELIIERPDGTRVNVLANCQPIFDESGKLNGGVNMLVDITGIRQSEKATQESEKKFSALNATLENEIKRPKESLTGSEERYHKMIEEVQDYAIILLDREGTILNWNKGAQHIKGYKDSEIIGNNFRVFYRPEDREAKLPEKLINEAKEKGKAAHEGWRMRKDGTLFWGSIVITALHDEKNDIIGFSKVTRDLTEKKLADDRLAAYAKDISAQNKQLEAFAYIASHDLQEPLRKIRIFSEMLEKNPGDSESSALLLKKINTAAGRMSQLINDVLTYSKVSQEELEFTNADLGEILQNVMHDYELMMQEKNASIIHSPLPVIQGIPVQLQQLFANLVSNSIKFNDKDPVIEISSELIPPGMEIPGAPSNEISYIKLRFKDNGVGLEPEYRDRIFELFQRLDPSKKGTGIGLALCKKIISNHRGFIQVSGEPGRGTTFDIYLPS